MVNYKKAFLSVLGLVITLSAFCQSTSEVAKDGGFMRSEGKIYVVMAVVLTILTGLIVYVFRLDRKISRLEKGNSL